MPYFSCVHTIHTWKCQNTHCKLLSALCHNNLKSTGVKIKGLVTSYAKFLYLGQCLAKRPFWGLNYITIQFVRYTKQHIFATVQPFDFKFCTLVSTSLLSVEIDFGALHIFHTVGTKCSNPKGYNCAFLQVRVLKTHQIWNVHRGVL